MKDGKPFVANPEKCAYLGECESACPEKAIARPFLVISCADETPNRDQYQ